MKNKGMKEYTTHSNSNTATLSLKDLERAIEAIKESSKQPYITHISSQEDWISTIKKDYTARTWSLYGGIPVAKSVDTPKGAIRVHMSDGTFKDFPFKNTPNLLPNCIGESYHTIRYEENKTKNIVPTARPQDLRKKSHLGSIDSAILVLLL